MTNAATRPSLVAFGLAVIVTAPLHALLTMLKEIVPGIEAMLAAMVGHHWIGHGLTLVILFLAIGIISRRFDGLCRRVESWLARGIVVSVALSYFAILCFFLLHGG